MLYSDSPCFLFSVLAVNFRTQFASNIVIMNAPVSPSGGIDNSDGLVVAINATNGSYMRIPLDLTSYSTFTFEIWAYVAVGSTASEYFKTISNFILFFHNFSSFLISK